MPLKDTNCRNAKPQDKPYRLYDEQGLYLEVQPSGGRYWRLKYRFLGKEKRLALGVYPEVGLQEARRKRDDARAQLAGGQDPSLQRRMAKVVSLLDHQHTFESVATQWLSVRESSWDPEYTRTVLVHNHPSGDPEPSQSDLTLTHKLQRPPFQHDELEERRMQAAGASHLTGHGELVGPIQGNKRQHPLHRRAQHLQPPS